MSVGTDISFHGFDHVYGIPEHATQLSLKTTTGAGAAYSEPYRYAPYPYDCRLY